MHFLSLYRRYVSAVTDEARAATALEHPLARVSER
jgi:hypothetical protein